jgi:hypothetical protein
MRSAHRTAGRAGRATAFAAALGLFLVGLFGLAAGPAAASTQEALAKCHDRIRSDRTATDVFVPGNGSAFVGQIIRPGDVIGVASRGKVSYGGIFGSAGTWGPDGNGTWVPGGSYPDPDGPQYALVGIWNQVPPGDPTTRRAEPLGSVSDCLEVPAGIGDGESIPWGLWLTPNDDDPSDNGGSYSSTVHLWFGSPREGSS